MMDPVIKAKWIAALRSDNYQQGSGTLRTNDNKFCCLGVLCDIVDPAGWDDNDAVHFYSYSYSYEGDWNGLVPPANLTAKLGLLDGEVDTLTELNDSARLTFSEIADWIEAHL